MKLFPHLGLRKAGSGKQPPTGKQKIAEAIEPKPTLRPHVEPTMLETKISARQWAEARSRGEAVLEHYRVGVDNYKYT